MSLSSAKPNLSYRTIFAIAIPVILANLAMPIQNGIDIAVVGHFNKASSLAGLSLATQLLGLVLVSFNFLQYASSGLAAQALGKASKSEYADTNHTYAKKDLTYILQRSLLLAIGLGIVLFFCRPLIVHYGLELISARADNQHAAATYLNVRLLGVMFELMNYAFIGWFAGQGLSKLMLYQQVFIAVNNICLTLLFVYGFNLGLVGVALGTSLAYLMGVVLALNLAARNLKVTFIEVIKLDKVVFKRHEMLRLLTLNKDIFIRTFLLTLSFTWIAKLSALQGDVVLAANALLLQVLSMSAFALDGVAVAAESLSGQAASQGKSKLFLTAVKRTGKVIFNLAAILSLIWYALMPLFITTLTNIDEVIELALTYRLTAALLPLVGAGAYWLDGVMFGLTAGRIIRNAAIIMAATFFPLSYGLYQYLSGKGLAMWAIWLSVYWLLLARFAINAWMLWRNEKNLLAV